MTIQSIRLSNFLAFEDTGWLEFRPIMFVYGKNSSGKSSISNAIAVMQDAMANVNSTGQMPTLVPKKLNACTKSKKIKPES